MLIRSWVELKLLSYLSSGDKFKHKPYILEEKVFSVQLNDEDVTADGEKLRDWLVPRAHHRATDGL